MIKRRKPMSEETKKKISMAKKGTPAWNKGLHIKLNNSLDKWREAGGNNRHVLDDWQRENGSWNKGVKGKDSHSWVDGRTTKNALERRFFVKTIQKEVLVRDNHTCQRCGAKKDLQVDHIQPWAEYVEGRFDINNLRTVCRSCHYFLTYGKEMPIGSQWGLNLMTRRTT